MPKMVSQDVDVTYEYGFCNKEKFGDGDPFSHALVKVIYDVVLLDAL